MKHMAAILAAVMTASCVSTQQNNNRHEVVKADLGPLRGPQTTCPVMEGKRINNRQVMECLDCKSAVANFFTTGKWQHTCATCGDNLSECTACK